MKRLPNLNPKVTCASCRKFDGLTWCKHWNQATQADSPPCAHYKVLPQAEASRPIWERLSGSEP